MGVPPRPKLHRRVATGKSLLKIIILFVLLSICLAALEILFQWTDINQLPFFLRPYSGILMWASPYLRFFNAAIILVAGYFIVGEVGKMVYAYMRSFADHSSAATVQNIARIVGFGVLLAVLASVFSIDPAAALTLGGFGGLVVGFATQTLLGNTIAGIFVLITRPFTFGDTVTIAGNTGVIKEIRIMHLHLDSLDGKKDILIPNSLILSQIILKDMPGEKTGLIQTVITVDYTPDKVKMGDVIVLTGQVTEKETRRSLDGATVCLYDRDIGKDDLLCDTVTDAQGRYRLEWIARKVDFLDDKAELYIKFEGDDEHKFSNTKQFVIEITK